MAENKFRQLTGIWRVITKVFFSLIPISGVIYCLHLPERFGLVVLKEQYLALFLGLLLTCCFLVTPATSKKRETSPPWYDVFFAFFSIIATLNVVIFYPELLFSRGFIQPHVVLMGGSLIVLLIEAARRLFGWIMVMVVAVGILYAKFGHLLPESISIREISWGRLVTYLYLDPGALFGLPLAVGAIIVLAFIFFGRFIFGMGGGKFLMDLSMATMGRYRGGPAKGAVVASSLFGMMSGSAAANVAMTGTITIPLMKKTGYQSHIAAGVESVASTGGVFLPPVMGAVAFIMAEFLEVPYARIAMAALVPALLYFFCIFLQVDIEAVKAGLKGLSRNELPSAKKLLKKGWYYSLPVIVLVYALFILYLRPETSALYAVGVTLLIFLVLNIRNRGEVVGKLLKILEDTGQGILELAVIGALAGLIIGVLSVTGLAITFSNMLIAVSGGNTFLLLLFAAVAAIVIGMGMPIAATYIMLVILIAPALVQLGIEPIAAHLFIMYFGALSFITPPICIAIYVACSISGSEPMKTALIGMRMGLVAYVVPFIFVYNTGLLLIGSPLDIATIVASTTLGIILLASALGGYLFGKLSLGYKIWLVIGSIALLLPYPLYSLMGFVVSIPVVIIQWKNRKTVKNYMNVAATL